MSANLALAQGEGEPVVLNGRFGIWPDAPMAQFSSPCAEAFTASDKLNQAHAVFALACDPELQPRMAILEKFKELPVYGIVRLLDWGIIPWPDTGDHRFVLIYEVPPGHRLVNNLDGDYPDLGEDALMARVIAPVAEILGELHKYKISHRGIRPTNLFTRAEDDSEVMLGENATTPVAYDQPPAFETIQSLQASPLGRYEGDTSDDIYALGVTILSLYKKMDPAAGRSAEALLAEKLARGSFVTLAGGVQLPVTLREALRGMLEDQPAQRWTLEDLLSWTQDRRLKSRTIMAADKAQRAFHFMNKSYVHPQLLSQAMAWNWDKVALKNKGHEVLFWARRSLGDEKIGDSVFHALELGQKEGSESGNNPLLTARLCMALDQHAPIRYKSIATHLEGLGPLMAKYFDDKEKMQEISEIFLNELPAFRVRIIFADSDEGPGVMRFFTRFVRYMKAREPGLGIERCLYDLNPVTYCRSPLIIGQKVMDLAGLLPALDKVASANKNQWPFDRHIAAFAASHIQTNIQMFLDAAADEGNAERSTLGKLGLLATIQKETGVEAQPKLGRWVGRHLKPATSSFRHKIWRERVERELPNIIASGDLVAIYRYLANGEARQRDRQGFAEAVAEYTNLTAEISFHKSLGSIDPVKTREYGHQLAAALSLIVGFAAMALTAFVMI